MSKQIIIDRNKLTKGEYREIISLAEAGLFESVSHNEKGEIEISIDLNIISSDILSIDNDEFLKIISEERIFNYMKQSSTKKENPIKIQSKRKTSKFEMIKNKFDYRKISKEKPGLFASEIKREIESFVNLIGGREACEINREYVNLHKDTSGLPRRISEKCFEYIKFVEEEINSMFFNVKLSNNNVIKTIDIEDFKSLSSGIPFESCNTLNLSDITGLEQDSKTLLLIDDVFAFNAKKSKKNIYKNILKINWSEGEIISSISDFLNTIKIVMDKIGNNHESLRGIEGNIFRFELLSSLSGGKYKISIDEDPDLIFNKKQLAQKTIDILDEYFRVENNYIIDLALITDELYNKCKYDFYNEHEIFFITRKFTKNFSEKFSSYRPPLVFRTQDKVSGKNVAIIMAKHLEKFIKNSGINNTWISKKNFFEKLFSSSGIKDHNFYQKAKELEKYGIIFIHEEGNRYKEGMIKFLIK